MTDIEISKALALSIGWPASKIHTHLYGTGYAISIIQPNMESVLRIFDYRDWAVIGPIAVLYSIFPYARRDIKTGLHDGKWVVWPDTLADTPQKAIAMAVIGAKK
jgi:hypothetical protein